MKNIDWKRKLSSRKFWAAVGGVIVALCVLFNFDEMTTQQVTALVSAVGVLGVYIFSEGKVDAAREEKKGDKKE